MSIRTKLLKNTLLTWQEQLGVGWYLVNRPVQSTELQAKHQDLIYTGVSPVCLSWGKKIAMS